MPGELLELELPRSPRAGDCRVSLLVDANGVRRRSCRCSGPRLIDTEAEKSLHARLLREL
jgi:hypothetical protein